MSKWSARLRFEASTWIGGVPALYFPLAGAFSSRADEHPLSPRDVAGTTDVVIEGFPRCGNTFATAAFLLAQPRPVEVAHHRHSAAQVIRAARSGVPCIVLIRDPREAIASFLVRHPAYSLGQALGRYIRFHEAVAPWKDRFVIAPFGEVTTDFGGVIRRVNGRFGTSFGDFRHDSEGVQRCFRYIEDRNRIRFGGGKVDENSVARPSDEREERKKVVRAAIAAPAASAALRRAEAACEALIG